MRREVVGFDINVYVFKYVVLFSFSHKWVELRHNNIADFNKIIFAQVLVSFYSS